MTAHQTLSPALIDIVTLNLYDTFVMTWRPPPVQIAERLNRRLSLSISGAFWVKDFALVPACDGREHAVTLVTD